MALQELLFNRGFRDQAHTLTGAIKDDEVDINKRTARELGLKCTVIPSTGEVMQPVSGQSYYIPKGRSYIIVELQKEEDRDAFRETRGRLLSESSTT